MPDGAVEDFGADVDELSVAVVVSAALDAPAIMMTLAKASVDRRRLPFPW